MLVLGLETATPACSVALVDDRGLVAESTLVAGPVHSERLMPMVEQLLEGAGVERREIGGLAVSRGPGSFTGLRIGIATAKALAYAWGRPLVGIPTLDALAFNAGPVNAVIYPLLEARRGEVYTAAYRGGEGVPRRLGDYRLTTVEKLLEELEKGQEGLDRPPEPVMFLGEAAEARLELLRAALGTRLLVPPRITAWPRAGSVAELGWRELRAGRGMDALPLRPIYLRPSEAEILWQRKHGKSPGLRS